MVIILSTDCQVVELLYFPSTVMLDLQVAEMQVPVELAKKNLGQGDQACLSRLLLCV